MGSWRSIPERCFWRNLMATVAAKRLPYLDKHVLSEKKRKAIADEIIKAGSEFNAASFARLPGVDIDAVHRRVKS